MASAAMGTASYPFQLHFHKRLLHQGCVCHRVLSCVGAAFSRSNSKSMPTRIVIQRRLPPGQILQQKTAQTHGVAIGFA